MKAKPTARRAKSSSSAKSGKGPKTTRQSAVAAAASRPDTAANEYTIEALAELAKTTVRNIRAYQDRGIIPPPQRRGRSGIYNEAHLSRLRVIGTLLARGYTLASIGELMGAWASGQDLGSFMGLEAAVSSPWSDEAPAYFSLQELVDLFGGSFDPSWLAKACEMDVLHAEGARFRARSPKLLRAGAELVRIGIPLPALLSVVAALRANVEHASELMVRLVDEHIFGAFGQGLPPISEAGRLRDLIWRLRPLVQMAVNAEVARAMETVAAKHLGDRLGYVLERFAARQQPVAAEGKPVQSRKSTARSG